MKSVVEASPNVKSLLLAGHPYTVVLINTQTYESFTVATKAATPMQAVRNVVLSLYPDEGLAPDFTLDDLEETSLLVVTLFEGHPKEVTYASLD
jgi:hypothetical protein